jgi:hypothetical protein
MQPETAPTAFDRLWLALRRAAEGPPADPSAWRGLPVPGELPAPWATWTLIGLVRHRRRQLWVGQIVRERPGGDLGRIAGAGASGHPDGRPQQGVVPGVIGWEYYFHGCGCCLTHRVTGESIDVGFHGDDAEGFDRYFYKNYLESLRDPPPPERRLIDLHPTLEAVVLAFDYLEAAGLLVRQGRRGAPRLSEAVLAYEPTVDTHCAALEDPAARAWLSALIGDWPAAEQAAARDGEQELAALVAERAAAVRRPRTSWLTDLFERGERPDLCLHALADLGAPELEPALTRTLRGDVCGTTSAAVGVIAARPDAAAWCPELFGLFARLDPAGQPPHPYLWSKATGTLLRHGHGGAGVAAALPRAGSHVVGEAAVLALEWLPAVAPHLLRRALRSDVPANRCTAAAALALFDQPWSRAELLAVLGGSDDQLATCECRAALAESRDPDARAAVLVWEARHPREPEPGPWISGDEVMLRGSPAWLRHEMDKLRDRLEPVVRRKLRDARRAAPPSARPPVGGSVERDHDEREDADHEARGSRLFYWLDDVGARPLTEARPDDRGFLFAAARAAADRAAAADRVRRRAHEGADGPVPPSPGDRATLTRRGSRGRAAGNTGVPTRAAGGGRAAVSGGATGITVLRGP